MEQRVTIPSYKIAELKRGAKGERDLALYRLAHFANNIEHLKKPHRHDHFAIFFVTGGQGVHLVDFNEYKLKPKRVFLIAPGQIHVWKSLNNIEGFALLFTREFFTLTLQYRELRSYLFDSMVYQNSYFDLDADSYANLHTILELAEKELVKPGKYSVNIVRSYINVVLFIISRLYGQSAPLADEHNNAAIKVKEFEGLVNRYFKTMHGVKDYAKILHITPNYLNFICNRVKGRSAGEIIHTRILQEAKRMLAHSENTVAEIAYELNFEDNSYFGRFFKRMSGITPVKFRDEIKGELFKRK